MGIGFSPTLSARSGGIRIYNDAAAAPAELADFYAPLATSVNATKGGGTLTGTLGGGASIAGGKLVCHPVGVNYARWPGTGNMSAASQTGAMRVKFTPNYTDKSAGANIAIMCLSAAFASGSPNFFNLIDIFHNTSGNMVYQVFDSSGNLVINQSFGAWVAASGVEVEFELDWNFTTGASRFFINGVQLGSAIATTCTRDTNVNTIILGTIYDGSVSCNGDFREFRGFNAVQHTSNYTPA